MDPAAQILKRTNPADLGKNAKAIETLIGTDKVALKFFRAKSHIPFTPFMDVPESEVEDEEEKPFLQCPYNEAEKAYRSPWTNRFYKVIVKGNKEEIDIFEHKNSTDEEKKVRDIEFAANEVWDAYTNLYYGRQAVGSVFLKPLPTGKGTFEGMFGIHKETDDGGSWDSAHLVHVDTPNEKEKTCVYKIESAVMCKVTPYSKTTVSSSLAKETVETRKVRFSGLTGSHLENLGLVIEQVEIDFRSKMERVDMPKTLEVVESIYRKMKAGRTSHLIGGAAEPSMATGMGVGAGMIGEIANRAKAKGLGGGGANPLMAAMQQKLAARAAKENTEGEDADGAEYVDMKKGLKKASGKPSYPKPQVPAAEFMDFRKSLRKTGKY